MTERPAQTRITFQKIFSRVSTYTSSYYTERVISVLAYSIAKKKKRNVRVR